MPAGKIQLSSESAGKITVKALPKRMCIGCGKKKENGFLLKAVSGLQKDVTFSFRCKAGRGAYFCPSRECLERALRRKAVKKALGADIACYQENPEKFIMKAIEAIEYRVLELSTAGDLKSFEKRKRLFRWIECMEKNRSI